MIRKIFFWIGQERRSIGEVARRLDAMHVLTSTGKTYWNKSVIWAMLKNPAYKGQAAYGKKKSGERLSHIRPQKRSCEQPKYNYSIYKVEEQHWIYIPVPAIIDENLFDVVQEQLEENKKSARAQRRGATYLLQGLVVCQRCRYSCYGKASRVQRKKKVCIYSYYRCTGSDAYRFVGDKPCDNKQIRTDVLDIAVWEEVKCLLKNPQRISDEYNRRIEELEKSPLDKTSYSLGNQEQKLKRGISRLIDSYAQENIDKEEFEPRIKTMKQHLKIIEEQKQDIAAQKNLKKELQLIITNLEHFSTSIGLKIENVDWVTKRDIIRALIKRIEINADDVNVVFRVQELSGSSECTEIDILKSSQHDCRSRDYDIRTSLYRKRNKTRNKTRNRTRDKPG